jgi:hypothetical protein
MDRKAIEAKIAQLRGELAKVEGTPTEVYSRIVGYYRSVRNWNAGKRQEYDQRLVFRFPEGAAMAPASEARGTERPVEAAAQFALQADGARARAPEEARAAEVSAPDGARVRDGILVFTKEHCPNCPPVKNFVVSSGIKAVFVDAEAGEGLALARDHGIMATPTVLGFDSDGRESFRAFDVKGLSDRLGTAGRSPASGIAAAGLGPAASRQAGSSTALKL